MKHKKIYISILFIIILISSFLKYNSINAKYKDYTIDSTPVTLNQEFQTNDFKITYIDAKKDKTYRNNKESVQYTVNIKIKNTTSKNIKYPSNKFFVLAPNYNYNQSIYSYDQNKKPIPMELKPNEEKEAFLIFYMPYKWGITKNTPIKIIYAESNISENKTKKYEFHL